MDEQNNNSRSKDINTNQNLESKMLKDKINSTRRNSNQVKQPRRYNPVNDVLNNDVTINGNMPDKESPISQDNNSFNNKNIGSFIKDANDLNKERKGNSIEDNNENIDDLNTSSIKQPNKRDINKNDNNGNNVSDPTQKKLNRLNQQKEQNKNQENNDKKTNDNKDNNNNNQAPNPNQNNPKTKGSANNSNSNANNNSKGTNIANNIMKAGQIGGAIGNKIEEGEEASDAIKEVAKEEAKELVKKKIREKIMELFIQYILPVLPYIALFLLVVFIILIIIFAILGIFDDEENVIDTIKVNYCEYVNVKWGEGLEDNQTISSNEYIKYEINSSDFKDIDNKEALKAFIIVLRTNLYANSDNLDSNVCYYEVDEPYEEIENSLLDEAIEETDNKVFTVSPITLSEIEIDDNFTYTRIDGDDYRLFQDKMSYEKNWVDSHVDSSHIVNDSSKTSKRAFSPFAAWYLAEVSDYHYQSLIFHFVTPGSSTGNVYKAVKIGPGSDEYGEYSNMCSDISLSTTSLERQEFIDKVNSYNYTKGDFSTFKTNAGKIYDIATNNNFNPEMVVIRAISEGFSPGGSTHNYWGIGCTNSGERKACQSYSSFDQGVLEYIKTVKKINSVSLFQMQYKYAYIGSNWFNPGSSSKGGCYYFPYVKKYLSESRASEVEDACQSGKTCDGSNCLPTTDEDQSAYTRYQIESMLNSRASVFDITADNCSEEGETVDGNSISNLGQAVADYAVKTYDSWSYSKSNRHQDGYVDCSSMVARAYKHFNVKIYDGSDTSGEIYRWCEKNGKTISSSSLAPGDLIFYNANSYRNSANYKGIGHVAMYIGGGQTFAAHSASYSQANQVSVSSYLNNGNLFCRPTK